MPFHWGDFCAEKIASHGEIVLGIDPYWRDIPNFIKGSCVVKSDALRSYVNLIVESCGHAVGFVKFQSAYFEAFGSAGITVLADSIRFAKTKGIGVILDVKRGDIGSTAEAYADAYLVPGGSDLEVDCITVNPYLGQDTLQPFLQCAEKHGKGLFILVRTSNPGSDWLQAANSNGGSIARHVATYVSSGGQSTVGKSGLSCVGAVVGATKASEGSGLRSLMPEAVILAPGLGAQGGSPNDLKALRNASDLGLLVPVSRGITKVENLEISAADYSALLSQRVAEYKDMVA